MKDIKVITIAVEDLVKDGVYLTHTKDLVQVKDINKQRKQLHLFNITEQCNMYPEFTKHTIVERVR